MTLPGFNAERSLYQTSVHYRLTGAFVEGDGVVPQQIPCGTCHLDQTGACVQTCTVCTAFGCFQFPVPCPASACVVVDPCRRCHGLRGCAAQRCFCECEGGVILPGPPPCHFECA
jgi:hypothetical protein